MAVAASTLALPTTSQLVRSGLVNYRGFAIRETSGAAVATVRIRDGLNATGLLVDDIQLTASESAREWYPEEGIAIEVGLYVEVVAGAVEGSLRIG